MSEIIVVRLPAGKRAMLQIWAVLLMAEVNVGVHVSAAVAWPPAPCLALSVDSVEIAVDTLHRGESSRCWARRIWREARRVRSERIEGRAWAAQDSAWPRARTPISRWLFRLTARRQAGASEDATGHLRRVRLADRANPSIINAGFHSRRG